MVIQSHWLKRLATVPLSLSVFLTLFVDRGADLLAAEKKTSSSPADISPSRSPQTNSKSKLPAASSASKDSKKSSQTHIPKGKKSTSKKQGRSKKGGVRGQKEIEQSRVIEIQQALAAAGFFKDEPTGKWDALTTQAMSAYQDANGFKVTGKPDALSLRKLGL